MSKAKYSALAYQHLEYDGWSSKDEELIEKDADFLEANKIASEYREDYIACCFLWEVTSPENAERMAYKRFPDPFLEGADSIVFHMSPKQWVEFDFLDD